jgi:hypothetical protein
MEFIAHLVEEVFRAFPDSQVAEQVRSDSERGQLSQSLEGMLNELAFSEYTNGHIHDLRGELK